MQVEAGVTYREKEVQRQVHRLLARWGKYESVQRFVRKYAKPNTRAAYLYDLDLYFRWLASEGVKMDPDALIKDNLRCIYASGPEDVATKRKHTDLLDRFVNDHLAGRGVKESSRRRKAACVMQFYKRNDAGLFGDFTVSVGKAELGRPALKADEIREVLKVLPIQQRVPLILGWQSGMEPGSVLGLSWGRVDLSARFLRFDRAGRKSHRRPYFTFAGRDSVTHLRVWRAKWSEAMGRDPGPNDLIFIGKYQAPMDPDWLNASFKETALRLEKQRVLTNVQEDSWRLYALRHIFSTECSHAGVKPEAREFFMGHVSGIEWVYQHPELHAEDLEKECAKVEPYVSLDESEIVLKEQYDSRERSLLTKVLELESKLNDILSGRAVRA